MTGDYLNAYATLGSVAVIGASAFAALIQLRHVRGSNELEAILSLQEDFRSQEVQAALHYVQEHLTDKLDDEQYRGELSAIGFVNLERHPELIACNWFTQMGTFLKHGLITESTLMDLYARLIRYYWKVLSPAIAIMRRKRGDGQYSEFEYLALRANVWLERHVKGTFPRGLKRSPLPDPWREIDERPEPGGIAVKGVITLERSR
jgi:hypothetical protein